jgi:hypothetical protein
VAADDGPPLFCGKVGSHQEAGRPIGTVEGLTAHFLEPRAVTVGLFGKCARYPIVLSDNGLHGLMLGGFHGRIQGITTGEEWDPLKWVDKLWPDDERGQVTVQAGHRADRWEGTSL